LLKNFKNKNPHKDDNGLRVPRKIKEDGEKKKKKK